MNDINIDALDDIPDFMKDLTKIDDVVRCEDIRP